MEEKVYNNETPKLRVKGSIKLSNLLNYQRYCDSLNHHLHCLKCLSFKISKPYLLKAHVLKKPFEDEYLKLLYSKHAFNRSVDDHRQTYQMAKRKNPKNIDILENYKKMQNLLNTDPDVFFNSNYNWYYSGGTLDTVKLPNNYLMLHASEGTNLCFSGLDKDSQQWTVTFQKSLNIPDSIIYEIKTNHISNDFLVGVRCKYNLYLYKLANYDSENLSWKLLKSKTEDSIPFISFVLNPHNINKYATLNVKQTVELWDINNKYSNTLNVTKIINTSGENWAKINYLTQNLLLYVNNISFSQTDLRTKDNDDTKLISELNLQKEKFTNISIKSENNFYLTTDKHVVEFDLRMNNIIHKWSHLLKESIFLSDNIVAQNENLIGVATENPNERLVLGYDEENIKMPLLAPNLNNSLEDCLTYQLSIDMAQTIRERNALSTTGLKFICDNNSVSLLTANSVGDVYVNELYNSNSDFDPSQILERNMLEFKNLDETLLTNIEKTNPLYFTDKVIIKNLNLVLNRQDHVKKEINSKKRNYELLKLKHKLTKKVDKYETHLNEAWEVEGPISQITEIEIGLNVKLWLSKINESGIEESVLEENSNSHLQEATNINDDLMFDELHESVSQFV